ncbi:malonic semialdehyde reductase [Niveibacterium sp. SC-1]|uniref:malonic semialdehyde reductase n=1 Tax=Niveibacterium sp. SC-1 TaxID=3135646 RepID=UPI00311F9280
MPMPLADEVLAQLFLDARTHRHWLPREIPDALLVRLYELFRMAPTSANTNPARIVFVKSPEAKAKLDSAMDEGNRRQTLSAPVTAIIAYDLAFYEKLDKLVLHTNARAWFEGNDESIRSTAFRNGSLQGAYLILAARALGLDCGPMSGFDNAKVDALFFPDGKVKSNFLCNLGYGDASHLHARQPRLAFDEACRID